MTIDRRTFLAGSTSVIALSPLETAFGADERSKTLVLKLSKDGREVIIFQADKNATNNTANALCKSGEVLYLHAYQFGPNATFTLGREYQSDATEHDILIDNAAVGARDGLRDILKLRRKNNTAPWTISFKSSAWGAPLEFPAIRLSAFTEGTAKLVANIPAAAAAKAIPAISGGRLRGRGKGNWTATIDNTLLTTLESSTATEFVGLEGRLPRIRRLSLQWDVDELLEQRRKNVTDRPAASDSCDFVLAPQASALLHRIRSENVPFEELKFVDAQKRTVHILSRGKETSADLLVIFRPLPGIVTPSIARLKLSKAQLQASVAAVPMSGLSSIGARDVLVVEARQDAKGPNKAPIRLVVSGYLDEVTPIECRTAVGSLLVSEAAEEKAKSSKAPGVEQKKQEAAEKRSRLQRTFDSCLALIARERAFDDDATIHLAADFPDGQDRPVPLLQRIAIRGTLHGADTALAGADWSTLRFGVPPHAMRRLSTPATEVAPPEPTKGTPVDFLYPMPATLRSDLESVVAIFPQDRAAQPAARISLTRAKLDVGVGGPLIDLGFGFRGMSLVIGDKARLVPDNTACGIIATPGGAVVDTRPIVILELPPQHVFEEAWFRPAVVPDGADRLNKAFATAKKVIERRRDKYFPPAPPPTPAIKPTAEIAGKREADAESSDAFYGIWREFFRQKTEAQYPSVEYYEPSNREHLSDEEKAVLVQLTEKLRRKFIKEVERPSTPPDWLRAHLSGRSRLAFRIHCAAVSDDLRQLGGLDFSLAALTNLGRHEPAVPRRAEVFVRPKPNGLIPPVGSATIDDVDGTNILQFQGISAGARTVFAHMDAVRTALSRPIEPHETALELVSRLIFSTSQRAIFLTDGKAPPELFSGSWPATPSDGMIDPECRCEDEELHRLWSVRLLTRVNDEPQLPDLRIVDTPDFRPEALRPWPQSSTPRGAVYGPPPYGNAAPWRLARSAEIPGFPKGPDSPGSAKSPNNAEKKRNIFERACTALFGGLDEEAHARVFRAGLSANDRHQLLLLSAAYGLPVIGKRVSDENGKWAGLIADSDQFEPGSYQLHELSDGHAIYAPKTLNVQELALSALGATFRHETRFNPPLPALLRSGGGAPAIFDGRPAFDGLSIEKWEHVGDQGRDEIDRVSYKGYLLPTGHKATFEKKTEREVVRTEDGGLRAMLVQRMYIKVNEPFVKFKRIEQPYSGRAWLHEPIGVYVPSTGEITDPDEEWGGRIHTEVGLAFWPSRVDIAGELVQFSIKPKRCTALAPMIFVDNVAAGDPAVLAKLCEDYNNADKALRTWHFGKAKLRCAPPFRQEGDTDLTLRSLVVRVTGRNRIPQPLDDWTDKNDDFRFTPGLEGEGRPPFFPVLESADVILDNIGTLTGGSAPVATAYYDGKYVREGFDVTGAAVRKNPLGVFMHFGGVAPTYDMGSNGDRTPMNRPKQPLCGISPGRPIGWADPPTFKTGPKDGAVLLKDTKWITDGKFVSLIHLFGEEKEAAAGNAQAVVRMTGPSPEPADDSRSESPIDIAGSCFPKDAKAILGTITFGDLFKIIEASGALDEILPALKQAMTFGLAVEEELEKTLELLKTRVLVPASNVLFAFEGQWEDLERTVNKGLAKQGAPTIDLEKIFPEISASKKLLRLRLDATIAEDDPLRLPDKLSELHIAGRNFLSALADFASHPAETLAANMRSLLDQNMGAVRSLLVGLGLPAGILEVVKKILTDQAGLVGWLVDHAVAILSQEGGGFVPERLRLLPWPVVPAAAADAAALAQIFADTFAKAPITTEKLAGPLKAALAQPQNDVVLLKVVAVLVDPLKAASVDARSRIAGSAITPESNARATALLIDYEARLDRLSTDANSPLARAAIGRLIAERTRLETIKNALTALVTAVQQRDLTVLLDSFGQVALLTGVTVGSDAIKLLADLVQSAGKYASEVTAAAQIVPSASEDVRKACQAWRAGRNPTAILQLNGLSEPFATLQALMAGAKSAGAAIDAPSGPQQIFDAYNVDLALRDPGLVTRIGEGISATRAYIGNPPTADGVISDAANLFCGLVGVREAADALQASLNGTAPLKDPATVQAAALAVRDTVQQTVLIPLESLARRTALYVEKNGAFLASGLLLGALTKIVDDQGAADSVKKAAAEVRAAAETFQTATTTFAEGLLGCLNAVLARLDGIVSEPLHVIASSLNDAVKNFGQDNPLWDKTSQRLLKTLTDRVAALDTVEFETFSPPTTGSPIDKVIKATRKSGKTLDEAIKSGFGEGEGPIIEVDAALQQLLQHTKDRLEGLPTAALELLDGPAALVIGSGQGGLGATYKGLVEARDKLVAWLRNFATWIGPEVIDEVLSPPKGEENDALRDERAIIANLPTEKPLSVPANRDKILAFAQHFANQKPAPVLIAEGLARLTEQIVRGDIFSLIDITALRDEIEDRLSALVPTKQTLTYSFDVGLKEGGETDLFSPKAGSRFEVGFRSEIDLLHPDRFTFESEGKIGAFDVRLVKFIGIDAITLMFGGASFRTGRGMQPAFDCNFQDFKIGPALKFLQDLQESLQIGESGVYIEPLTWTSGLRVGYALDIGIIPLGNMSFSNVSVALAADLPFTDDDAIFTVSIGRRLAPFSCSILPFQGSGYLSIISTANRIIGFEFGLEFGFGGAYQCGPLVAQGRVQAGIAVRTIEVGGIRATEISGTFYAGGSASIWIFSFSASLSVRLIHNSATGGMRGEAVYSFSFKVGFAKFSYQVRITYGQDRLSSGSSRSASNEKSSSTNPGQSRVMYAQLGIPTLNDASGPDTYRASTIRAADIYPESSGARQNTVDMTKDWSKYSEYFDDSLLKRGAP